MGQMIDYEKLMTEQVFINLPGPEEPTPGMSGPELLHGFMAELYRTKSPEVKSYLDSLCTKWNVHYQAKRH
jgi:hypothetical protein